MWNRWGLALVAGGWALALATSGGCSEDDGGTRIVVTVDSDIAADADPALNRVVISVSGGREEATAEADVEAGETLPRQLTLTHEGGGLGPFVVTATGRLSGATTVTQIVRGVFFEEGREVAIELSLDAACIDACGEGESCKAGECSDGDRLDAGAGDSGAGDSSVTDPDAGDGGPNPSDAGADAADDGAVDAGDGAAITECQVDEDCDALASDCSAGVCGADGLCTTEAVLDGTECGTAAYCIAAACTTSRDCKNGTCDLACRGNSSCAFDCADSSSCGLECRGRQCVVDCRFALLDCGEVDCTKGGCLMLCAEATSCAFATCHGVQEACDDETSVVCGRGCPGEEG